MHRTCISLEEHSFFQPQEDGSRKLVLEVKGKVLQVESEQTEAAVSAFLETKDRNAWMQAAEVLLVQGFDLGTIPTVTFDYEPDMFDSLVYLILPSKMNPQPVLPSCCPPVQQQIFSKIMEPYAKKHMAGDELAEEKEKLYQTFWALPSDAIAKLSSNHQALRSLPVTIRLYHRSGSQLVDLIDGRIRSQMPGFFDSPSATDDAVLYLRHGMARVTLWEKCDELVNDHQNRELNFTNMHLHFFVENDLLNRFEHDMLGRDGWNKAQMFMFAKLKNPVDHGCCLCCAPDPVCSLCLKSVENFKWWALKEINRFVFGSRKCNQHPMPTVRG